MSTCFRISSPTTAAPRFQGLNYALKDLNAGFTTIQDMGSPYTYASVELRDAINKGLVPGSAHAGRRAATESRAPPAIIQRRRPSRRFGQGRVAD